MPTTAVEWDVGYEFDRHVLRGQSTGRLDQRLVLRQDVGPDLFASNMPRPADVVDIRFIPGINAAPAAVVTAHGVRITTATGEVEALAAAPVLAVRNFLVHAEVTVAGRPDPFRATVRVHVHGAVNRTWCSPSLLSIHQGADGQQLSVLAQFDDDTVGDITHHPGITWASAGPAVVVNPGTGALTGTAVTPAGAPVRITATLPADLGGGMATGDVAVLAGWGAQPAAVRAATLIAGPGRAVMASVPNALFVAEGFEAAELPLFEEATADLVRKLRTSRSCSPFNLLRGSINYWRVFIPSRQAGQTALHELDLVTRPDGQLVGNEIAPPRRPDPAGAGVFTLGELIHEVGLPVPADGAAAVTFATKLPEWITLYNVAAGRVNAALFDRWKALQDRRLASERDTALGLAEGQRPAAAATVPLPGRYIGFHPLRGTRAHLDQFLATVTDRPGGPVIGATWVRQPAPGKDRDLVIALCGGAHGGGGRADLIATGLATTQTDVLLAAVGGSREVNVRPHQVPRTATGAVAVGHHVLATCMHETAHGLGLGDEYGGNRTASAAVLPNIRAYANAQALQDLDPVNMPPMIQGDNVRWRWPRLRLAGQLTAAVLPAGGGFFRVQLAPGHAVGFARLAAPDNIVRLRQPLTERRVRVSGPLEVVAVAGDEVRVRDPAGVVVVADYPPGSVLCQPVPAPASAAAAGDTHAELMAQRIRAHLNATHGPLNAPAASPLRPCAELSDPTQIQDPTNLPAGLRAMPPTFFSNWIVGLYEAGAGYDCGVYHPTGICLMRQLRVPQIDPRGGGAAPNPGVIYRFCHVCQYFLVDRIDPRLHEQLDRLIAREYPQS